MKNCTNPLHQLESVGVVRPFEDNVNHYGVFRRKTDYWEFVCLAANERCAREISQTLNRQTLGELFATGPVIGLADIYAPLLPLVAEHSTVRATLCAFNERVHETSCEMGESH